MKKIIELAIAAAQPHATEADYLAFMNAVDTPITEDWLKEHGWLQNGMTQEDLEACDWENCDDTWCHPTEEISIYIDYPENKILFCQDGNHEIWINNSLADLYDACGLCGIKID